MDRQAGKQLRPFERFQGLHPQSAQGGTDRELEVHPEEVLQHLIMHMMVIIVQEASVFGLVEQPVLRFVGGVGNALVVGRTDAAYLGRIVAVV